jgi:hypothetical protein
MDLHELKRLHAAARQVDVSLGDARGMTLRLPTQHELTLATCRSGMRSMADDGAALAMLERILCTTSVVAWHGIRVGDVLSDHPQAADALEYHADAVAVVFDAQPAWAKLVWEAMLEGMAQRKATQDTAAKN